MQKLFYIALFLCFPLVQNPICALPPSEIFSGTESPTTLTLDACKRIALDQNPSKKAAIEGYYAAMATVGMTSAPFYPHVSAQASYKRFEDHLFFPRIPIPLTVPFPSTIGPFNDYYIGFSSSWILYDFGGRRASLMASLDREEVAREEVCRIQQEILLEVVQAFFDLAAAKELLEVAKQTLERAQDHVKIATQRKDAGDVPLVDVLRSKASASQDQQNVIRAKNRIRVAQGKLNVAMGLPPYYPANIVTEPTAALQPSKIHLEAAVETALASRPELTQQAYHVEALREEILVAYSAFGPKLVAGGDYGKHDDSYFPQDPKWSIGLSLQLPLFQGYKDTFNLKKTQAEYYKGCAEYEKLELEIQRQVWNALSKIEESYEAIMTAEIQVADAKESARLSSARYQSGAGTITDMLDSDTALARANAEQVRSKWNYQSAYAAFLWTQGYPPGPSLPPCSCECP